MKTILQLSIEIDLKERLKNFSSQTGIPMSRIISNIVRKYLPEEERKQSIQLSLEETTETISRPKIKKKV